MVVLVRVSWVSGHTHTWERCGGVSDKGVWGHDVRARLITPPLTHPQQHRQQQTGINNWFAVAVVLRRGSGTANSAMQMHRVRPSRFGREKLRPVVFAGGSCKTSCSTAYR